MFPWTHPQVHPSNKFLVWSPHYIKLLCFLLKLQSNKINNDKYFYPHKIWYKTSNPILLKQRTQNVWLDLVQYFPFHFLLVQIDRLNKVTGAWTTPCCWHFVSWRIFWYISKLYFPLYTVPDVPTHLSKVLNPLINYENQGFDGQRYWLLFCVSGSDTFDFPPSCYPPLTEEVCFVFPLIFLN